MAGMLRNLTRRVPWARRCVWSLKYRLNGSVLPYNGLWDRAHTYLRDLQGPELAGRSGNQPKLLIYASAVGDRFWVDYFLPLSVLLAARGAVVDFVWSDSPPRKPNPYLDDFCDWSSRFARPSHDRWKAFRLEDCAPDDSLPSKPPDWLEGVSRSDASQIVLKESLDEESPADRAVLAYRKAVNLQAYRRFSAVMKRGGYDRVLTTNGGLYESCVLLEICKAVRIPCITTEISEGHNTLHFVMNKSAWECDVDDLWADDEPHVVSEDRAARVQAMRRQRQKPGTPEGLVVKLQSVEIRPAAEICEQLRLDAKKPTAVLFANVAWDSGVLGKGRAYPTMRDWLVDTVRWFGARPDWQLVIRAHPHEDMWGSNETVRQTLSSVFDQLPENVRLVGPTDRINTYGLAPLANFGLVFTTTVGLEMALDGLPIVTAGRVHYAGHGFTMDPNSPEEYRKTLASLTESPELKRDARRAELAICYFDLFMNKLFRPMPWRRTHLEEDIVRRPIAHLSSDRCEPEFAMIYDFLMGRRNAPY
jgi:hypothetical protein